MYQGFIDLRQNQPRAWTPENFWPSFTDIMMVVTMIFMLVATVLMVHHWRMSQNLAASTAAQAAAEQRLTDLEAKRARLLREVAALETERAKLRERLAAAEQRRRQQADSLASRGEQLQAVTLALARAKEQLRQREEQLAHLQAQQAHSEAVHTELRTQLAATQAQLTEVATAYQASMAARQAQAERLQRLEQAEQQAQANRSDLRARYEVLKDKYDKLTRPARSPEGKQVVAVRYQQRHGSKRIDLKAPTAEEYQPVSATTLHRQLAALRERHGDQLYVKVVIPEDSGLSYNEAWSFTQELLSRYDYYYQ